MAISNELSSEIASAILAAKDRSPQELKDLKEIVIMVHHTLQQLTQESRQSRYRRIFVSNNTSGELSG